MLKAAIFDLNGIFIQSPKLSDRFEKDFGIPSSEFLPKLFEIMAKVRQPGAMPAFEYWRPELERWNMHLSEEDLWKYWFSAETPSEEMIGLAKDLRARGIRVIILSNNFQERADYYGHYPWLKAAVDKVYYSFQTGFVKPDPAAWQFVLREDDLRPEECIYFDDQEKNVAAAKSLGIPAFLFVGVHELRNLLQTAMA